MHPLFFIIHFNIHFNFVYAQHIVYVFNKNQYTIQKTMYYIEKYNIS